MKKILLFAIVFVGMVSCNENTKQETTATVEHSEKTTEQKTEKSEIVDLGKFGLDVNKRIPKGINVGDKAPIIETEDINKQAFNSQEVLKDEQIVVLFYRGEWCPVCNRHLSNLEDSLQYITEKNARVIVIGPESVAHAENTAKATGATFTILSDTDGKIQTAFDVLYSVKESLQTKLKDKKNLDLTVNNEQEEAQLPVPATYIINQEGEISFKQFDYNYKNRASVKDIISNL